MINLKEAIKKAEEHAKYLFGDPLKNLQVEEYESSEDEDTWLITLGWDEVIKTNMSPIQVAMGLNTERVYKIFYVNKETGNIDKMKMI